MSTKKTIAKSFTVSTIEDGVSVQAQYAPNANPTSGQIHTVWHEGDLYMRTRESDESAWSSWHKIVGESGDETDFSFGISQYKTTANASTAPSDISSWSDAPLAVTTAKPYLWAKVQQKSWNASTQAYVVDSTRYIRLTGEDGYTVEAQYAPNNNPTSSQIHTTWQDGDLYMRTKQSNETTWSSWHKIVGESGDETDYTFNISKSLTSSSATTAPANCYYNTWQDAPIAPTSTYPYLWMKIVKKTWNESTQSYDSGTARYARITGEPGSPGGTGPRGKIGRFFYYAGAWNDFASTDSFLVNDAQAPYFAYNSNYWVFNPETNGTYTKQNMGTPSSSSSNWQLMTNDFKYLITEAIFGSYAHFGSAIINGDWMISQHGTVNGDASTDYTKFNPQHPTDNYYDPTTMLYNFIPNFAIDLKKGQSIMNSMVTRFRNIDNDYIWRSSEDAQTYGGVAGWVYQLADYSNIMTNAYAMQTTAHPYGAMRIVLPMDVSFIGRTFTVFENSIPPLPSSIRAVEILLEEEITNNTGVFYGIGKYNLTSPSSSFVSSELNLACGTVELVGVPAVVNNQEICRWLVKSTCCALLFDDKGHVYYGL